MKQLTGNQVRQMFLDYFESKGHMIEPGASLVPNNDPTLLWINAGVAALKKYFDGSEKPKRIGLPMRKNPFVPTTSKTLERQPVTIRSLKCLATSPLRLLQKGSYSFCLGILNQ